MKTKLITERTHPAGRETFAVIIEDGPRTARLNCLSQDKGQNLLASLVAAAFGLTVSTSGEAELLAMNERQAGLLEERARERDRLVAEIAGLNQDLANAITREHHAAGLLEESKAWGKERESERDACLRELEGVRAAEGRATSELATVTREANAANRQLAATIRDTEANRIERDAAREESKALRVEVQRLSEDLALYRGTENPVATVLGKLAESETARAEQLKRLNEATSTRMAAEAELKAARVELAVAQGQVKLTEESLAHVRYELGAARDKIREADQCRLVAVTERDAAKEALRVAENQITEDGATIQGQSKQALDLWEQLSAARNEKDAAAVKVMELTRELSDSINKAGNLRNQIEVLQTEMAAKDVRIEGLGVEAEELKGRRAFTLGELAAAQEGLKIRETREAEHLEQLERCGAELAAAKEECRDYAQQAEALLTATLNRSQSSESVPLGDGAFKDWLHAPALKVAVNLNSNLNLHPRNVVEALVNALNRIAKLEASKGPNR